MCLYQFVLYTKTKNVTAVLLEMDLRASKLRRHTLPSKLRVEFFSKFRTGMKTTSMFHTMPSGEKYRKSQERTEME